MTLTPPLSPARLREIATTAGGRPPCPACARLASPGWESLPAEFDLRGLQLLGTLRAPSQDADHDDEPTWAEHHPAGTRIDSPRAPIAPAFHPYNRSEVWACTACGKPFLRYTEFGGYYVDPRVRELDASLLVD